MDETRDPLLSRAALPRDEDGRVRVGDLLHDVQDPSHRRALGDGQGSLECVQSQVNGAIGLHHFGVY